MFSRAAATRSLSASCLLTGWEERSQEGESKPGLLAASPLSLCVYIHIHPHQQDPPVISFPGPQASIRLPQPPEPTPNPPSWGPSPGCSCLPASCTTKPDTLVLCTEKREKAGVGEHGKHRRPKSSQASFILGCHLHCRVTHPVPPPPSHFALQTTMARGKPQGQCPNVSLYVPACSEAWVPGVMCTSIWEGERPGLSTHPPVLPASLSPRLTTS